MLSRSGLYALQAALHLAGHGEAGAVSAAHMASELQLPPDYLAKVLKRLKDAGIVSSSRGANGGYRLAHDPAELTIDRVVGLFEETGPPTDCLLGGPCDPDDPCPAHRQRLEWNAARGRIFASTSLADLLPGRATNGAPTRSAEHFDPNHRT